MAFSDRKVAGFELLVFCFVPILVDLFDLFWLTFLTFLTFLTHVIVVVGVGAGVEFILEVAA